MTKHLDDGLEDGLDPAVAGVLRDWAELHNRFYELVHWLVNGRSRAPVAVVRETDADAETTTVLILKILGVHSGPVRDIEYGRHRRAEREAPGFAKAHLSTFAHEAITAPGRRWITFQRIAGKSLEKTEVLTVLLRRMLGIADEVEPTGTALITCDPPTFADACRKVVAGVLWDWAGPPFIPPGERWNVATFFRRHLLDQMEPGGRLAGWAQRHQGEEVVLAGEAKPLPNPFAVAQGRYFSDAVVVTPFLSRCHGDLHSDNALVRVRPSIEAGDYYLIDTALYESSGPLTRDPVHFVLYIIARSMEAIKAPSQQAALIDLLLDPLEGPAHLVPGWLAMLVQQVDAEAVAWVEPTGLALTWREQTYLSLTACAMLFLGRTSTREEDKPWFFRLAARAAARFARLHPDTRLVRDAGLSRDSRTTAVTAGPWIGWLCRDRPDMEQAAKQQARQDEARKYCEDALSGLDRTNEYREFVREIGGPDPDVRFGTRGNEGQSEPEDYLCPLDLCARRERRLPGGAKPVCNLNRVSRLTLRSSLD